MIFNAAGGGGGSIEGMLESYRVTAGGSVSAGDFVQYVNQQIESPRNVMLDERFFSGYYISAVKLDETRALIVHGVEQSPTYPYAMVITINGDTITAGEDTPLSNDLSGSYMVAVKLDAHRVFVAQTTSGVLYGAVVTVDGATITPGVYTQLDASGSSARIAYPILLENDRVLILHNRQPGDAYYLYGLMVAVDGTTITPGADTQIHTDARSAFSMSGVKMDRNRVFIAHSWNAQFYLYGTVITIEGMTITPGPRKDLSLEKYAGSKISATRLDDDRVFVAHCRGDSYDAYGTVATINGTAIAHGDDYYLSGGSYVVFGLHALALDKDRTYIAYGTGKDYNYLSGMCVTIDGTVVTRQSGTAKQLVGIKDAGYCVNMIHLDDGRVFIAHSQVDRQWHLYYIIPYISGARKAHRGDPLLGVAKTGGAAGKAIDVYLPITKKEEQA